jgi:hypothetical protein
MTEGKLLVVYVSSGKTTLFVDLNAVSWLTLAADRRRLPLPR